MPVPRSSHQETMRLIERAQAGDRQAAEQIVRENEPLVAAIGRYFRHPLVEAADLMQEGRVGLCRAIAKFDTASGHRFSTYATYWVRQAMGRCLQTDAALIRLPAHVHEKDAARRRRRARGEEDDPPARDRPAVVCSLDQPAGEDDGLLTDVIAGLEDVGACVDANWLRLCIAALIEELPPANADVLNRRYGLAGFRPHSYGDLAAHFGISREGARHREWSALDRVRQLLRERPDLVRELSPGSGGVVPRAGSFTRTPRPKPGRSRRKETEGEKP